MSDKLKPNFTPVPNMILDEIMRTLTPGALKVLFAICRFTYGWGKQSDRISLNQLAEITGLERSNVHRAVKQLGYLVVVTPGNSSRNQASEYRLNVEISDVDLVSVRQQGVVSLGQQPVVRPVVASATIRRKPKKEDRQEAPESVLSHPKEKQTHAPALAAFEAFYQACPLHVGKAEAQKAWLKLNPDVELITVIMAAVVRYAAEVQNVEPRYIKHPGPWLNGKRWEDEPANGNGHSHGRPAEVKDLGDGWLEVDGMKISRKDFERRWKTAS